MKFLLFLFLFVGCCEQDNLNSKIEHSKSDTFFQYASKEDLLVGNFEGNLLIGGLKEKGDFGIGTINNIDGEMLILDNNFYSIKSSGDVISLEDSVKIPYANVKFFDADTVFSLKNNMRLTKLHSYLSNVIPANKIAAVKVEGSFKYIKSRSIDSQTKPYPPLSKVIEEQTVFEFETTEGTIVGFYIPEYLEGLNFPGYHFHFLKKDLSGGGHLLDCVVDSVNISLDYTSKLEFDLELTN
ncbi:MAG: acetolactate decarboxylase [Melioribacteraceae bacterium]|nr:acetolactate decarboxylase [Melioribacteraceae bacterium]